MNKKTILIISFAALVLGGMVLLYVVSPLHSDVPDKKQVEKKTPAKKDDCCADHGQVKGDDHKTESNDNRNDNHKDDHKDDHKAESKTDHQEAGKDEHGHDHGGEGQDEEMCGEHNVLEAECGICQPQKVPEVRVGRGMKIRMGSSESAGNAGIRLSNPQWHAPLSGIRMPGKVTYNLDKTAHITSLLPGVADNIAVRPGDRVRKGQVLLFIVSNEIVKLKENFLNAGNRVHLTKARFLREKTLLEKKISSMDEFQTAQADFQEAEQQLLSTGRQLLNLGFTKDQLQQLSAADEPSPRLPLRAPFDGTIVFRNGVNGEAVEPGQRLLTLVNLDDFWLELSVPEQQLAYVRENAVLKVLPDALPDVNLDCRLKRLASEIDETTRTVKGRAVLRNVGGVLKHGMYAQVYLQSESVDNVLTVPAGAVHFFGDRPFVFVKLEDDLYEVRRVTTGSKQAGDVEIRGGLMQSELIVADHSFIIKSELLKSRLGAGCVDD